MSGAATPGVRTVTDETDETDAAPEIDEPDGASESDETDAVPGIDGTEAAPEMDGASDGRVPPPRKKTSEPSRGLGLAPTLPP